MKRRTLIAIAGLIALTSSMSVLARKSTTTQNLTVFNTLFKELNTFYVDSLDASKSITTAITAMLDEIDPYTEYIPSEERENFERQTTGEYGGIGSFIMERHGSVYASGPQKGSPAQKSGLRHGDRFVKIDGDSVAGLTTAEVSKRLRGVPNTTVKVEVMRPWVGADSIIEIEIVRQKIQERSVDWSGVLPDSIGYISLTGFTEKTPDDITSSLNAIMTYPGLRGLVLDLRGNGGGLVESAVKVLSNFLPKNTEVLRMRGKERLNEKIYRTSGKPRAEKLPLVVLTDGGTASASEIVSGALQDLDRAVIIGERSFGKGLVQTTRPLPYDNLLKVTTARYYIPSGRLIQAIDYSRRNPDGSVARTPDSLTNEYRTRGGRIVRDGGGITPDIKVEHKDIGRLTYNIVKDNWAFDYANRYRAEHESLGCEPGDFVITDEMYADFKRFIDPERFQYDKVCEIMMERLKEVAEAEGYLDDSTRVEIETLSKMLKHDLNRDLDTRRKDIEPYLSGEIVERYYWQPGRTRNVLNYDPDMARARALLHNPDEYRGILKGEQE